jgi:hypothetical protein
MSKIYRQQTHPSIILPGIVTAIIPGYKFGNYYVILQDSYREWGIVRVNRARNPLSILATRNRELLIHLKLLAKLWDKAGLLSPEQMWEDLIEVGFPTDDLIDCALSRKFLNKEKSNKALFD